MFKIGDFSKITNLTVRALHHYEEFGLLQPAKIDEGSNYRYYSAKQLETVNQIKLLQQVGFSLKVIKEIMSEEQGDKLDYYYQLREKELQADLAELQRKQRAVKLYRERRKEGNTMGKYHVELKELPRRKVMSLRTTIDAYDEEGTVWNELHQEFLKQKVKMANPPRALTIFHDKEYKEDDIDIEVQSDIVGEFTDTETVKFFETEPLQIASVTFNGSFEQMPEVTQALANWLEANDHAISGPMINISHVSPAEDPNPENWVTEAAYVVSEKG